MGSVMDVIAGKKTSLLNHYFSASDVRYGFELGSPQTMDTLGETVIVNKICFTTATNQSKDNYMQTITGDKFITSGLFLIPNEAKPTFTIHQTFTDVLDLNRCYEAWYEQIKQPFAFAGFVDFEPLHMTAVAQAPVHDENIFEHASTYYPYPPTRLSHTHAFVIGVVADYQDKSQTKLLKQLEVVLYKNPLDRSSRLTTHAHAITLSKKIQTIDQITSSFVNQTVHVLSSETQVRGIKLELFAIDALRDYGV